MSCAGNMRGIVIPSSSIRCLLFTFSSFRPSYNRMIQCRLRRMLCSAISHMDLGIKRSHKFEQNLTPGSSKTVFDSGTGMRNQSAQKSNRIYTDSHSFTSRFLSTTSSLISLNNHPRSSLQRLLIRRCKDTTNNFSVSSSLLLPTCRHLHVTSCAGLFSEWCSGDPYQDPSTDLQDLLLTSLYAPEQIVYRPTVDDLKHADDLFKKHQKLEMTLRVVDNLPPSSGAEVCFIGRSNVGKSSLIKALFFDPPNLKIVVSKRPGRTRTLNFYSIDKRLSLVDMPGYGYNMPENYVESVENFIRNRNDLVRTFLLIDGQTGFTSADKIGIEMLQEFGKPYVIVMTKIDKTSHHRVLRNLLDINKEKLKDMSAALPQIFLVSSHKNVGLSMLRAFIVDITGLNRVQQPVSKVNNTAST